VGNAVTSIFFPPVRILGNTTLRKKISNLRTTDFYAKGKVGMTTNVCGHIIAIISPIPVQAICSLIWVLWGWLLVSVMVLISFCFQFTEGEDNFG
jgi:hypothetical protein